VRVLEDQHGNLYVWRADLAIHSQITNKLGLWGKVVGPTTPGDEWVVGPRGLLPQQRRRLEAARRSAAELKSGSAAVAEPGVRYINYTMPGTWKPGQLEVLVNPDGRELRSLAKEAKHQTIRVSVDTKGNLYAWEASEAIHDTVVKALHIKERDAAILALVKGRFILAFTADPDVGAEYVKKFFAKHHVHDAFNPEEARDPHGEWTGGGAETLEISRAEAAGEWKEAPDELKSGTPINRSWDDFPFIAEYGDQARPTDTPPERTPDGDFILYHGTSKAGAAAIMGERRIRPDDLHVVGVATLPGQASIFAVMSGVKHKEHLTEERPIGAVLRVVVDKGWLKQHSVTHEVGGSGHDQFLIRNMRGTPIRGWGGIPPEAIKSISEVRLSDEGEWKRGGELKSGSSGDFQNLTPDAISVRRTAFAEKYGADVANEMSRLASDWYSMRPTSHIDSYLKGIDVFLLALARDALDLSRRRILQNLDGLARHGNIAIAARATAGPFPVRIAGLFGIEGIEHICVETDRQCRKRRLQARMQRLRRIGEQRPNMGAVLFVEERLERARHRLEEGVRLDIPGLAPVKLDQLPVAGIADLLRSFALRGLGGLLIGLNAAEGDAPFATMIIASAEDEEGAVVGVEEKNASSGPRVAVQGQLLRDRWLFVGYDLAEHLGTELQRPGVRLDAAYPASPRCCRPRLARGASSPGLITQTPRRAWSTRC
jgi:hypothetical protein